MLELNLELARVIIAVLAVGFAAYEDWKTSFINNRLMYTAIASGVLLNLLSGNWSLIAYSLGGAAIIFAGGWFLYKSGQLGGGDVLLFVALHLLLPVLPINTALDIQTALGIQQLTLPAAIVSTALSMPFAFSVLAAASVLSLVGTASFYFQKLLQKKTRLAPNWKLALPFTAMAILFMAVLQFSARMSVFQLVFFAAIFACGIFLSSMKKQIEDEVIVQEISVKEIEDEDVLALDRMNEKIVEKYKLQRVLTLDQVKILEKIEKEQGIHRFPVMKVLPRFGPYVFWGLLASILTGDVLITIIFS